jgi:hypothetical protein
LLDELWSQAVLVGLKNEESEMSAMFIDSLNSVIDFHTKRVVVFHYRIPTGIWIALYGVCILSMAGVGYQFGTVGTRDLVISLSLAISFSTVIWLIADLERGDQGIVRVGREPMVELDKKLNAALP